MGPGVRKRSFSLGPALIASVGIHVAVIVLLIVEFPRETTRLVLSAVPVEIVSNETHEAAPHPPEPETPPAPTPEPPQPTPAPAPPAPQPPAPKSEPKPVEQPKPAPAPTPLPKPVAKPTPPKPKPETKGFDLGALTDSLAGPTQAKAAPHPAAPSRARPGQGKDAVSTGPDIDALNGQISGLWHPNCVAPGADKIQVGIRIRLRSDGSVADGPHIENPHPEDRAWVAAAESAARAARAVRYRDLPQQQLRLLTDRGDIYFRLDERAACQ